jgi:hypothetical protein
MYDKLKEWLDSGESRVEREKEAKRLGAISIREDRLHPKHWRRSADRLVDEFESDTDNVVEDRESILPDFTRDVKRALREDVERETGRGLNEIDSEDEPDEE